MELLEIVEGDGMAELAETVEGAVKLPGLEGRCGGQDTSTLAPQGCGVSHWLVTDYTGVQYMQETACYCSLHTASQLLLELVPLVTAITVSGKQENTM